LAYYLRRGVDLVTSYVRLASEDGKAADVLIEVDESESLPVTGEQNAGLRQWA
jgi:hypothetical protein